jgi:Ca2+/H+ antiporter, TMEM165/GDT1 family
MSNWLTIAPAVTSAFLASLVEVVEAFTIVLAVASVRGARPAIGGTLSGLAALALMVLIFGPAINRIPLAALQFAVGVLLLLFGLRWLRKAVLRAAGIIALHDEDAAYRSETAHLTEAIAQREARADWLAGVTAFKAVVVEGLEVVFIVIAVGAGRGLIVPASFGALGACALVLGIGALLHQPLRQVPENALKFGVGVMLSGFGVFWTGEALGVPWPGEDLSIPGFIALFLASGLALVAFLRSQPPKPAGKEFAR